MSINARRFTMRRLWPTLLVVSGVFALSGADARDDGQWEGGAPEIRQWFRSLMQPDQPAVSCCGEADAYWADDYRAEGDHYIAIVTDDRDIPFRPRLSPGTQFVVPNKKLKFDAGNPTGHGILFVGSGAIFCYVVPGGV